MSENSETSRPWIVRHPGYALSAAVAVTYVVQAFPMADGDTHLARLVLYYGDRLGMALQAVEALFVPVIHFVWMYSLIWYLLARMLLRDRDVYYFLAHNRILVTEFQKKCFIWFLVIGTIMAIPFQRIIYTIAMLIAFLLLALPAWRTRKSLREAAARASEISATKASVSAERKPLRQGVAPRSTLGLIGMHPAGTNTLKKMFLPLGTVLFLAMYMVSLFMPTIQTVRLNNDSVHQGVVINRSDRALLLVENQSELTWYQISDIAQVYPCSPSDIRYVMASPYEVATGGFLSPCPTYDHWLPVRKFLRR